MKTTKLLIAAMAVAAAFAAVNAQGQNLNAELLRIDPYLAVEGTFNDGINNENMPVGVLKFSEFDAFCIEPLQPLGFPETLVYQINNPLSPENSDRVARLIGGYLSSPQSPEDAAAVQWAIWETTTEALLQPSLASGNVRITSLDHQSTSALADFYLANVQSYSPVAVTFLTNADRQDVVTWNVVPEPTSAGLAALSGLLLLRRRRA